MRSTLRLTLALAVLFLAACATTRNPFPKITVYGGGVAVDRVSDYRLESGELQIVVSGRSTAAFRHSARYRAQWLDDAGRPIDTVLSTWNPIELDARRPFDLTFVAPGPRASDYRIEIEVLE